MNSPSRQAVTSPVACVSVGSNSRMICANPGATPVMQELHKAGSHKNAKNAAATRFVTFREGQLYVHVKLQTLQL